MKKLYFSLLFIPFFYISQTTQTRNDAGAMGAGVASGFFETSTPNSNYPTGATGWWHLLDIRHSNTANNYAMQFAGGFSDQNLWFRKTDNLASRSWRKVVLESPNGNVGIGTENPENQFEIANPSGATLAVTTGRKNGTNTTPLGVKVDFLGYANFKRARILAIDQAYWSHKSKLSFFVNNGTSENNLQEMMTIDGGGNVGIGVTSPTEKLEVNGNLKINNGSSYPSIILGQEANDRIIVDNSATKAYGGGYFFRVHNEGIGSKYIDAMKIAETGNVSISNKLEAKEIKVTTSPTADFVFEENYNLPKLEEVEKHIKEKKHLPEIASAKEMEANGVNVGDFQIKLLQKIEELTLYTIEQNKLVKEQAEKIKALERKIANLQPN